MYVQADASASMLRKQVRLEPSELGVVKFSWLVPELIDGADMELRELDDSPVRIILAFEGDRSRFSATNASLSGLAHLLTGEEIPYATPLLSDKNPNKINWLASVGGEFL